MSRQICIVHARKHRISTFRPMTMEVPSSANRPEASRPLHEWDAVVEQVSAALESNATDAELRRMVIQWCAEARRRDLAPEQFLVILKSQFLRVPALRQRRDDGSRRDDDLERIVTMCIEEYFSEHR